VCVCVCVRARVCVCFAITTLPIGGVVGPLLHSLLAVSKEAICYDSPCSIRRPSSPFESDVEAVDISLTPPFCPSFKSPANKIRGLVTLLTRFCRETLPTQPSVSLRNRLIEQHMLLWWQDVACSDRKSRWQSSRNMTTRIKGVTTQHRKQ
jgi:hypothetical protein